MNGINAQTCLSVAIFSGNSANLLSNRSASHQHIIAIICGEKRFLEYSLSKYSSFISALSFPCVSTNWHCSDSQSLHKMKIRNFHIRKYIILGVFFLLCTISFLFTWKTWFIEGSFKNMNFRVNECNKKNRSRESVRNKAYFIYFLLFIMTSLHVSTNAVFAMFNWCNEPN